MMNVNTFKKKSKMSMKYFLRKDYISQTLSQKESDSQFFQLYVEFIFKRKPMKCKSLWVEFISKDSCLFEQLKDESYTKILGYSLDGISDRVFSVDFQNYVNGKTLAFRIQNNDLARILTYEKYHAQALFNLFRDIDEDKLNISNFGMEYKNTVIFIYDFFEAVMREKLVSEFENVLPKFPKIFSKDINIEKLAISILQIISLTDSQYLVKIEAFRNFCLLMTTFSNVFKEYLCFSNNNFSERGLTLPLWISENHSVPFKEFLIKRLEYLEKEEKELLNNIIDVVDIQIDKQKKLLLNKFS